MAGVIVFTDFCFFFQAEDGIRDFHVTGVQTCALPISWRPAERTRLRSFISIRRSRKASGAEAPDWDGGVSLGIVSFMQPVEVRTGTTRRTADPRTWTRESP